MSSPDDITEPQLPATVRHEPLPSLSAIDTLAELQKLRAGTKTEISTLRELQIPPAQIIVAPGGRPNDFFARTSGSARQLAFVYRDGEMVETGIDGEDVESTYDLVLKELHLEEENELRAILEELDEKKHLVDSLECQPGREGEAEAARTRILELESRYRELRPILTAKREKLEGNVMNIPVGTILFIRVQNAPDLYPVIVVEEEGMKWIETMSEAMPNGRVRGGTHPRGFRIPLRNYTSGGLYLPTGLRRENTAIDSPHTSLPKRLEDKS